MSNTTNNQLNEFRGYARYAGVTLRLSLKGRTLTVTNTSARRMTGEMVDTWLSRARLDVDVIITNADADLPPIGSDGHKVALSAWAFDR